MASGLRAMAISPNPCTFAACESPIPFQAGPFCTQSPTINGMPAPQLAAPSRPSFEAAPLEGLSTGPLECEVRSSNRRYNLRLSEGHVFHHQRPNLHCRHTLLTAITDPFAIRRILAHFGLPAGVTPLSLCR